MDRRVLYLTARTLAVLGGGISVPKLEEKGKPFTSSRFGFAEPPAESQWKNVEAKPTPPPLTPEQKKARQKLLDRMRNKK